MLYGQAVLPFMMFVLIVSFFALIKGVQSDNMKLKYKALFCVIGACIIIVLIGHLDGLCRK